MRKNTERKMLLVLFGIFLVNSIIFYSLFKTAPVDNNRNLEYDHESPLKKAGYWDLTGSVIYIDDLDSNYNWSKTAAENAWCSGSGTWEDPYIIENVTISGLNSSSCITIKNSLVYFRISNCTLYNSSQGINQNRDAGIKFHNTSNGRIINNNCSNNNNGIILYENCYNNTISINTVNNNYDLGIGLYECNDNIISGNIANYNSEAGLYLFSQCHHNTISGNTFNDNFESGIDIDWNSNNNFIFENTLNNNYHGITVSRGNNNIILKNTVNNNTDDAIFLIGCYKHIISGNIIKNNSDHGVVLHQSNDNTISGNIAINKYGIYLHSSNNTVMRGNILLNSYIDEFNCENNTFEYNIHELFVNYLVANILDQSFSKAHFNISISVYNTYGYGVEGATIQMWWNGTDVSSSVIEVGNGIYKVSLTPIFVSPGDTPKFLNFTVLATGYQSINYELGLAVDPETVEKVLVGPSFDTIFIILIIVALSASVVVIISIIFLKKRVSVKK